ncbi:MAG: hypothetical protein ACYDHY_15465 [Acidiferrobacterales bacterium]
MSRLFGLRSRFGIAVAGVGILCATLSACGGGGGGGGTTTSSAPAGTGSSPVVASVATLTWDTPNQDMSGACISGVSSYQIHYGTSADSLSQTATVQSSAVSCTNSGISTACGPIQSCTYPVKNLTSGATWYFAVQVTDTSGQSSGYSNMASKAIP